LLEELESSHDESSVSVNGYKFNSLFFADDIVLLARGPRKRNAIRRLLKICENHSYNNAYEFNTKKTKTISTSNSNFFLYDQPIEVVVEFKYLGIIFTKYGINWKSYIGKKLEKAGKLMFILKQKSNFNLKTRLLIYRTFIRPCFEYGFQILPYIENDCLKKIETFQDNCLKTICGMKTRFISLNRLRLLFNIPPITSRLRNLKFIYRNSLEKDNKDRMASLIVTPAILDYYGIHDILETRHHKGEIMTGRPLLKTIIREEKQTQLSRDKVLSCLTEKDNINYKFLQHGNLKDQRKTISFLMRRFTNGTKESNLLKSKCAKCNQLHEMEDFIKCNTTSSYRSICRELLTSETKQDFFNSFKLIQNII
jgi:hypothetical protein